MKQEGMVCISPTHLVSEQHTATFRKSWESFKYLSFFFFFFNSECTNECLCVCDLRPALKSTKPVYKWAHVSVTFKPLSVVQRGVYNHYMVSLKGNRICHITRIIRKHIKLNLTFLNTSVSNTRRTNQTTSNSNISFYKLRDVNPQDYHPERQCHILLYLWLLMLGSTHRHSEWEVRSTESRREKVAEQPLWEQMFLSFSNFRSEVRNASDPALNSTVDKVKCLVHTSRKDWWWSAASVCSG